MKSQFLALTAARVLAACLQAGTYILLSRLVAVDTFGSVGVIVSAGAFILLVTDWGITGVLSRARTRGSNALVRGCLRINDTTSLAVGFGAAIATLAASGSLALSVFALSVVYERNSETQLSVFYADGHRGIPLVSVVARRLVALAAFAGTAAAGLDGLWAFVLGQALGITLAQLYQRRGLHRLGIGEGRVGLRALLKETRHFWLGAMLGQVRLLDTVVVAVATTTLAAGVYSAAQRLTSPALLLPAALSQVLLPYATRSVDGSKRVARQITFAFAATYIVIVPACVFSSEVLGFVFGPDYASGGAILTWVLLGLPLVALTGPLAAILQGQGKEAVVSRNSAAFAVLAVAGMCAGVALDGAEGLAAGLTIASLLRLPVIVFVAWRGEAPKAIPAAAAAT